MPRSRHILAAAIVTAALCADRTISAAPLPRPHVAEMAVRLVDRLSQPFRRTAPSAVCVIAFKDRSNAQPLVLRNVVAPVVVVHCDLSPFEFRLPPPAR